MKLMTVGLLVCALAVVPASAQKHASGDASDANTSPAKKIRQSKQQAEQSYSCPMHPEVKATTKGKCPKCGMDLRLVDQKKTAAAEADEASDEVRTASLKMNIPDTELLDQNGRKLHFYTDLVKGHTVVINFIFTTCTTICPPLGATFARVQKELGDKAGRDVRFISISVDPATDTPERLKAWGAKFHAADSWIFVTGNKPDVDELLRALGASSARREDHSPTVLIGNDAHGTWTRTYGLANTSTLVHIINDVIAGNTATTTAEVSN